MNKSAIRGQPFVIAPSISKQEVIVLAFFRFLVVGIEFGKHRTDRYLDKMVTELQTPFRNLKFDVFSFKLIEFCLLAKAYEMIQTLGLSNLAESPFKPK
jgi:hypothetical protein